MDPKSQFFSPAASLNLHYLGLLDEFARQVGEREGVMRNIKASACALIEIHLVGLIS